MSKFTSWVQKSWTNLTHPEQWGSSYFYPVGLSNSLGWGNQNSLQLIRDFIEVPEVNCVINYRAWAQSLVNLEIKSKTTGQPISNNEPIVKILRKPNYFQTQKELWRQTEIFRSVFGNEYFFFLTPIGLSKNYKGLFTLPPQYVTIEYPTNSTPFFLNTEMPEGVKYLYDWSGRQVPLNENSILHLNDNNIDQKPDTYLSGMSKLDSLRPNISNIRASYEARNVILTNRGAIGILSNNAKDAIGSTMPMSPKEKKTLQGELSKYGVLKSQYKYILTNLSLKWTQITTDLDKLKVFEEVEEDFRMICNEYGTPYELFAGTNITYENKEKAEKQFYQDTVIPTTQERIQAINDYIGADSRAWKVYGTFDHLPIFQEDINQRSEALDNLVSALNVALGDGAITVQEYKEELQKFNIGEKK